MDALLGLSKNKIILFTTSIYRKHSFQRFGSIIIKNKVPRFVDRSVPVPVTTIGISKVLTRNFIFQLELKHLKCTDVNST